MTTTDETLSPERRWELEEMLRKMRQVSQTFYWGAFQVGCHGFIEFCGLMNKYIDTCKRALDQGVDFERVNVHSGRAFKIAEHDGRYLGEKLACIYGTSLASSPEAMRAVLEELGVVGPDAPPGDTEGLTYAHDQLVADAEGRGITFDWEGS